MQFLLVFLCSVDGSAACEFLHSKINQVGPQPSTSPLFRFYQIDQRTRGLEKIIFFSTRDRDVGSQVFLLAPTCGAQFRGM